MSYTDKVESGRMGLQGFTEAARAYGKKSRTEVLSFGPLDPIPEEIARVLGRDQQANKTVDLLVRRRFWDEEPMTVEHVAICHEYIEGLQAHDFEGSLFALIEKRVPIAYSHQEVEAVLIDPDMIKLLHGKKTIRYYSSIPSPILPMPSRFFTIFRTIALTNIRLSPR